MLNPKVIFSDKNFLVLDKPAGLVVNRAETVRAATLQDWLEKKIPGSSYLERSGIVHRLDKETSGLLVVAKTKAALVNLQKQFKERVVKKKYLALVHGRLEPKQGTVVLPISRTRKNREKFGVQVNGRPAKSQYRVLQASDRFSFLEVEIFTGRTHQIRVHFSFLGHPVVSDAKYGGKRGQRDRDFCPRLFLHAAELGFYHPETGEWQQFKSSLPFALEKVILNLCGKNSSQFSA